MVTSRYNVLQLCIFCVMRYERDAGRAIINFSLTYATIITDSEPFRQCKAFCRSIQVLEAVACSKHLQEHAMDIESYHRLLKSPYKDPLMSSCMLLYHNPLKQVSRGWCVRKHCKIEEEPQPTTALSLLLDTSVSSLEITELLWR